MSDASVGHTYYEKMKGVIDPAFFVVTGFFGLEKLRSVELVNGPWINGPMTHQAMAFAGAVNGLTIYLVNRMGQAGPGDSPYYKAMLTIIGLTAGALVTPYAVSKVLKSHALLITPEMSFRIAAFNLVAKVAIYVAFTKAEQYYNAWNFPAFHNFDEMTEHTVRVLHDHFKGHADLWRKESFKKQLGFNQVLQKYGLDPLNITDVDLEVSLTKSELETFRKLFEKGELTPEQATLLYNFHVSPQENRAYKAKNLPIIDPRKVKVENLSDEQIRWQHEWIIRNSSEVLHPSQIRAFVPHFYRLDLLPPSPSFVTKLPLPRRLEGLSGAKVSYLAHFYLENHLEWSELLLKDQIALKEAFAKHGLDNHPLREPTIDELWLPSVKKKHLKEFKKHFKEDEQNAWLIKSRGYQEGFNKVLSNQGMKVLEIPEQPWSTTKKVVVFVVVPLAILGIASGITWLALANRGKFIGNSSNQDDQISDPFTGKDASNSSETTVQIQIEDLSKKDFRHQTDLDTQEGTLKTTSQTKILTSVVRHDENRKLSPETQTKDADEAQVEEVFKNDRIEVDSDSYFEGETQCLLRADAANVSTFADLFFESFAIPPNKTNTVTIASPPEEDNLIVVGTNAVGFPNLSVEELTDVDHRENIDSYDLVYMTPDGVGSREFAPKTFDQEEEFSAIGASLSGRSVFLEEQKVFDNSTLIFDKMCIEGYSDNGVTCTGPELQKKQSLSLEPQLREGLHSDEPVEIVSNSKSQNLTSAIELEGHEEGSLADQTLSSDSEQEQKLEGLETLSVVNQEDSEKNEGSLEKDLVLDQTSTRPSGEEENPSLDAQKEIGTEPSYSIWSWGLGGVVIFGIFLKAIKGCGQSEKKEKGQIVTIHPAPPERQKKQKQDEVSEAVALQSSSGSIRKSKFSSGSLTPPSERRVLISPSPKKSAQTDPQSDRRKRIDRSKIKPIPFSLKPAKSDAGNSVEDHSGKTVNFAEKLSSITPIDRKNALNKGEQIAPLGAHVVVHAPEQKEIMRVASDDFEIPPINYVGIDISRKDVDLASYTQLLKEFVDSQNDHELDYLVIDAALETGGEQSIVRVLEKESVLKLFESVLGNDSLRIMKLRGFEKITVDELKALKIKCPNVSCFDLEGVTLEGDLDESFKDCLVLHAEKGNRAEQEERFKTGITKRIEAFNTGTHTAFDDLFGADACQNPLGPMRLFVESVAFLKGLGISDSFIKNKLHPNLMKNFPNIRLLDLSNCSELTLVSFKELVVIKIESLILEGCKKIFKRDSKTLAKRNKVAHWWLTDAVALKEVAQCFVGIAPFVRFVSLYDTHNLDFMEPQRVSDLYQDLKNQGTQLESLRSQPDKTEYCKYLSYLVLENMTKIMTKTKNKQDGYRLELVQIGLKGHVGARDIRAGD